MTPATIQIEDPRQPEVERLLAQSAQYMAALYPSESNHLLDAEALAGPEATFLVARSGGQAVGCAALRRAEGYGEIKRMYVAQSARGLKLGAALLEAVEAAARKQGLPLLRLETGVRQPEAIGLYQSRGFVARGPFGDYGEDPLSLFMEKPLP